MRKKIIFLAFLAEKFTCIISAITAQEKMSANIVYKLQFLATNVLIKLKHTHIPPPVYALIMSYVQYNMSGGAKLVIASFLLRKCNGDMSVCMYVCMYVL